MLGFASHQSRLQSLKTQERNTTDGERRVSPSDTSSDPEDMAVLESTETRSWFGTPTACPEDDGGGVESDIDDHDDSDLDAACPRTGLSGYTGVPG